MQIPIPINACSILLDFKVPDAAFPLLLDRQIVTSSGSLLNNFSLPPAFPAVIFPIALVPLPVVRRGAVFCAPLPRLCLIAKRFALPFWFDPQITAVSLCPTSRTFIFAPCGLLPLLIGESSPLPPLAAALSLWTALVPLSPFYDLLTRSFFFFLSPLFLLVSRSLLGCPPDDASSLPPFCSLVPLLFARRSPPACTSPFFFLFLPPLFLLPPPLFSALVSPSRWSTAIFILSRLRLIVFFTPWGFPSTLLPPSLPGLLHHFLLCLPSSEFDLPSPPALDLQFLGPSALIVCPPPCPPNNRPLFC